MHNSNRRNQQHGTIVYIALLAAAIILTVLGIVSVQKSRKESQIPLASKDQTGSRTLPLTKNAVPGQATEKAPDTTVPVLAGHDQQVPKSAIDQKTESTATDTPVSAEPTENTISENTDKGTTASDQPAEPENTEPKKQKKSPEESPRQATESTEPTDETSVETVVPDNEETTVETAASNLHFNQEQGLLWPVLGDVILNYSMDESVYFKTLGQYKCNPGILIQAKKNTPVYAAADGIVEKIEENDETGTTITCAIGDDFQVIYGQLKDVAVNEGDQVTEGQTLAKLAKPSSSYVLEDNHLFFEVMENGTPVNPMLLLR